MRSERSMVSTETKLFTSSSSGLCDVRKIMNLHFEKSLSMLFRIFALKQNLNKPLLIRALKNGSSLYISVREFSLCFFLGGEGGGGMVRGQATAALGANFRDYSTEINYQLLFLMSLSFSKIYRVSQKFFPLISCTITFDQNFIFTRNFQKMFISLSSTCIQNFSNWHVLFVFLSHSEAVAP